MVEKEFRISHGPTILGGGLTNRPFIKGMKPVSLSEDGTVIELEEISESGNPKILKEVNESMKKTLEELKTEQETLTARITELEGAGKKDDNKELSELKTQLDEISASIKELSDQKGGNDETLEDLKKTNKELKDTKKELEDLRKDKEDGETEIKKLSDNFESLGKTVKSLMASKEVLEGERHKDKVSLKLEEFKKKGAFPATIETIKKVVFSDEAKDFSVTLSEGKDDDKKDVVKSFLDVVDSILESIPKEHRFSTEEASDSIIDPTGGTKMSVKEVEKYAKDNEITFQEAMIELDKEHKLKDE